MAQLLSQVAVGSIVKLNESGSPVEFYVAKHDYESGLNGAGRTLLVRKDCHSKQQWNNSDVNAYATSTIDSWFNGTYKSLLDSDIQVVIGETIFYYTPGNGDYSVETLSRAVFCLSVTESGNNFGANVEGSELPIASLLTPAKLNGADVTQWTRSPRNDRDNRTMALVPPTGIAMNNPTTANGARPIFTLPGATTFVQDDGTIVIDQPPSAPGSINVPTVAAGQQCAITWTAATDPDGTIASYTLERSVNASGWTQVFSGNALTYTDTIGSDWGTVAYRVCAVDNYGVSGPYATSETQTVQDGILYISGPANAMGYKVAPFAFEITTGVSGSSSAVSDVAVEIHLDGNQVYSATVTTGQEISVTIDPRTIGGGSHTIEATASKTDYIAANESYTFSTPSLSLPDGGLGVQLQDDQGRAVFPQSIAALIAGLGGKSVAGNLQDLIPAVADLTANQVKVGIGSYIGTGTYGAGNPCSLTFDFSPIILWVAPKSGVGTNFCINAWIYGCQQGLVFRENDSVPIGSLSSINWSENGITWSAATATGQANSSGVEYLYVCFGVDVQTPVEPVIPEFIFKSTVGTCVVVMPPIPNPTNESQGQYSITIQNGTLAFGPGGYEGGGHYGLTLNIENGKFDGSTTSKEVDLAVVDSGDISDLDAPVTINFTTNNGQPISSDNPVTISITNMQGYA